MNPFVFGAFVLLELLAGVYVTVVTWKATWQYLSTLDSDREQEIIEPSPT